MRLQKGLSTPVKNTRLYPVRDRSHSEVKKGSKIKKKKCLLYIPYVKRGWWALQTSWDKLLLKGKYRKAHRNVPLLYVKLFTFLLIPSLCSPLILSSKREPWCVQRIPVLWFINAPARRPHGLSPRNATIIIIFWFRTKLLYNTQMCACVFWYSYTCVTI